MHNHQTTFTFGDTVYLKTDPEQHKRMVTGIKLRPTGTVYEVNFGVECTDHYEFEMSASSDEVVRLSLSINK